jgi:hypothetical protein
VDRVLSAVNRANQRGSRWRTVEGDPPARGRAERDNAGFLGTCREQGLCSVEKVRAAWLAWRAKRAGIS